MSSNIATWFANNKIFLNIQRSGPETIHFEDKKGKVEACHCVHQRVWVILCSCQYSSSKHYIADQNHCMVETQSEVYGCLTTSVESVLRQMIEAKELAITGRCSGDVVHRISVPEFSEQDIHIFKDAIIQYS